MPELPDVEAFRRFFERHGSGQRIERVTVPSPDVLRNTTPQGLGRALHRRRFGTPRRHGKWLFARTDDGDGPTVVLHFAMTGYLTWKPIGAPSEAHDRVSFVCADGELRFNQSRKLGGVWLAREPEELHEITGRLGPDALGVDGDAFLAALADRRGMIKSALMNQEVLAGLGNLTVDELLWKARVHPQARLAGLDDDVLQRVHQAMEHVIAESVRHGRVPAHDDWLTGARGEPESACPRCATSLQQATVQSRSTYWCPRCQPPEG